jgi:uncharacterized peroxidase-related enzyme
MGGEREAGMGGPESSDAPAGTRVSGTSRAGWGRRAGSWALAGSALLAAALLSASRAQTPAARPGFSDGGPVLAAPLPLAAPGARRPTYVLFQNSTSTLERQFLVSLRRDGPARDRDDIRVVLLNSLDGPIAHRFGVRETPTLLALEPGGREISRRVGPEAITATLAANAAGRQSALGAGSSPATCQVWRGPRLRWVEESDPRARRVYRRFAGGQWGVPDIFKTMSLRPELMEKALDLSEIGHFSDGFLDRRTKERIATFVSALNGSHYCTGSHAGGLRDLGARPGEIEALTRGDLEAARLSPGDRVLFEFVRQLTLKPGEIRDEDVARLRAGGWRDEQIFEAAFDASLFSFFNRMAITYGLDYPPDGWKPSPRQLRTALRPTR